jgi:lipoate-protein ligase A
MRNCWRYIEDNQVSAAYGLAADEYLMRAHENPDRLTSPALRLYTYHSHCALVGRFQDVAQEIDIEFCRAAGIPISRRPTGGGAILMGDDQLGMALVTSTKNPGIPDHPREIFELFSRGICRGLESLGIHAAMRGKNDLVVNHRKIAGLGLCRGEKGAFLFHASLLVDIDTALMLRVLKIAPEKLAGKPRAGIENNLTTIRRELGKRIAVAEVRKVIRQGFEAAMGVSFEETPFSIEEREQIAVFEKEKFANHEWVFGPSSQVAMSGVHSQKTPAGLLRITVFLVNEVIRGIQISGDFFADGKFIRSLEGKITGLPAIEAIIRSAIRETFAAAPEDMTGVKEQDLTRGVALALEQARLSATRTASPYGCFVAPNRG